MDSPIPNPLPADLNAIENAWSDMVGELQQIQVMHQEEFWKAVSEISARLKRRNQYWRTLTNSMVIRIWMVICVRLPALMNL